MKRNTLLVGSLYFLIFTALLHLFAVFFYLYWNFPWFDMIVHLAGGIAGTLFIFWLASFGVSSEKLFSNKASIFTLALVGSFSLGVVWEIFEYRSGITSPLLHNYRLETAKDLVMDIVGGMTVAFFLISRRKKSIHPNFS